MKTLAGRTSLTVGLAVAAVLAVVAARADARAVYDTNATTSISLFSFSGSQVSAGLVAAAVRPAGTKSTAGTAGAVFDAVLGSTSMSSVATGYSDFAWGRATSRIGTIGLFEVTNLGPTPGVAVIDWSYEIGAFVSVTNPSKEKASAFAGFTIKGPGLGSSGLVDILDPAVPGGAILPPTLSDSGQISLLLAPGETASYDLSTITHGSAMTVPLPPSILLSTAGVLGLVIARRRSRRGTGRRS